MNNTAYSYIRFSRPEQMKGHSLDRQRDKALAYCEENNLVLDESLNLKDLGVSAFRGKNFDENQRLGSFIIAIDEGRVKKGSWLLVENFDRLSRQDIDEAYQAFRSIIKKGITIVTLTDNRIHDENSLKDFSQMIVTLAVMSRAHEESKSKSDKVLAAKRNSRENIGTKKLTSICPAWLTYDKKKDKFKPDPEKVKAIKTIFKLCASGLGIHGIIGELNKNKIKPIGRAATWGQGYIHKILKGREVLGMFTSNSADGVNYYDNYYPAIVPENLYYKAHEAIATRTRISDKDGKVRGAGGRIGTAVTNLFSKIIVCGYSCTTNKSIQCSSHEFSMICNNKGKYKYLQCRGLKTGACKKLNTKNWRYDDFENTLLQHLTEIDASVLFSSGDKKTEIDNLKEKLTTLKGNLKDTQKKITIIDKTMFAAAQEGGIIPKTIRDGLNNLEAQAVDIKSEIDKANGELIIAKEKKNTPKQNAKRLRELIKIMSDLEGDDLYQLRIKLSNLLRSSINKITVYNVGTMPKFTPAHTAKIEYKTGEVRYIIQDIFNETDKDYITATEKEIMKKYKM